MKKGTIEQIKGIEGVKSVEPLFNGYYIVTSEPEKVAVDCTGKTQIDFIKLNPIEAVCIDNFALIKKERTISFLEYLAEFHLIDEWLEYSLK